MIVSNKVQCGRCAEVIVSRHRHDFVVCSCGATSVDGGNVYLKRSFEPGIGFIELSETAEDSDDE